MNPGAFTNLAGQLHLNARLATMSPSLKAALLSVVHLIAALAVYRYLITGGWLTNHYQLDDPNIINLVLAIFEPIAIGSMIGYWLWRKPFLYRFISILCLVQILVWRWVSCFHPFLRAYVASEIDVLPSFRGGARLSMVGGPRSLLQRGRFCEARKARMVTRYGEPGFGGEGRSCFRRREQAEHRMGDSQGLGRGRSALGFQLSGRATEGECRGVGGGVWRRDTFVSLRCFERRGDHGVFQES